MLLDNSALKISASDLGHFLSCRHLAALDLGVALHARERPPKRDDPLLDLLIQRGKDHEAAYVASLGDKSVRLVDLNHIPFNARAEAIAATLDAMRSGADIIVQAGLEWQSWQGRADILRRVPVKSKLGDWSYEVIDTKLARETRAGTILQLGLYSAMVEQVQGEKPEQFHVVVPGLGGTAPVQHSFRVDDFAAYFRLIQREMLAAIEAGADTVAQANYPEPIDHCDICQWWRQCDDRRHADDHLSLVANLARLHRRELETREYGTLTALAGMKVPVPFKPKRGSRETYERARQQARVQLTSRGKPAPLYTLRPPEPVKEGNAPEARGFARLPEPSPGDIFLDLEGDQYADEGGREYLFGIATVGADGKPKYEARWAFTAQEERAVFEAVIDFIIPRLEQHPGMHVYHYAPYEPSAFRRLMGRYATRADELDVLLKGRRFIDLYAVVRQTMWVGVESYSIKRLEPAYGFQRDVDLPDASHALRRMEYALQLGQPELAPDEDRTTIEGYNRDDCVSTLRLRDWLEEVRLDAERQGIPVPRPVRPPDEKSEELAERDQAVHDLRERLLPGIPIDPDERSAEQQARWILAYLLDYHRRESKATWWEYFRLRDLPEEDLFDERQAVVGLGFVERVDRGGVFKNGKPKGPVVDRYRYPEQEIDIGSGATLRTAGEGKDFGEVAAHDRVAGTIDIRKSRPKAELHPKSLFAFEYVKVEVIEDAILRLGQSVAAAGAVDALPRSAAADLLLRNPPRLRAGKFEKREDETVVEFAVRVGLKLDRSLLAIQGPPGSGKTHTGAEMICALVAAGKKVGVTANSHKVIRLLIDAARAAASEKGFTLAAAHKNNIEAGEDDEPTDAIVSIPDNAKALGALESAEVQVLGGTAWLWARQEFEGAVDVLFVDEAGQMALANVLAVAQAAKSVVLLGDPQQLDQPQKASHPEGVAVPALQHLLGSHQTMPAELGMFLPTTWRMSPRLCEFTSELYYERRLTSTSGLERQELVNAGELSGSDLHVVDVLHDGNRNHAPEEVAVIGELVERLTSPGVKWRDEEGRTRQVTLDDILVVSPYNAQVSRLIERLGSAARVGTVDKFQGQQAPVVIYSMATSRPEDAPRGMEFLYNPSRLNVATSRAKCAVILVASPHLFQPECRSVRQMKLANGLCRFRELAKPMRIG